MDDPFERATIRAERELHRERDERTARGTRTGFRIHATAFVGVQLLLVLIWALAGLLSGFWHPWFLYALGGWGVGLAVHYMAVRDSMRRG
jgi:hypothetical protein